MVEMRRAGAWGSVDTLWARLVSFGVYGTSVGARARAKRRRLRNHRYTGAFQQWPSCEGHSASLDETVGGWKKLQISLRKPVFSVISFSQLFSVRISH